MDLSKAATSRKFILVDEVSSVHLHPVFEVVKN
jgi:hypothetical protein